MTPGPAPSGRAEPSAEPAAGAGARDNRWTARIGTAVGVLLLAAAVWVLAGRRGDLAEAIASVRHAPAWLIGAAVLLPLLNWILVALSFWVLMGRYGRVGLREMSALVAAAWLLNYLPMRPGLAGRLAYHKLVNRVSVRDAAKVTVAGILSTAAAVGLLLAITVVLAASPRSEAWAMSLALPAVGFGLAAGASRWTGRGPWRVLTMLLLRYLDVLVWTARYAVVFALVGSPIGVAESVAAAAVSQAALAIPFVGNGLGVREWAIGLTAGLHPGFAAGASGVAANALGLAADLVNRTAEVLVAVPVGLASWWWLRRRLAASER